MQSQSTRGPKPVRRLVAIGAIGAFVVAGALAGCSSGSTSTDDSYTPAPKDTSATITYAIWDETQKPGIDANIASFNQIYPDITVNVTVTPWEDYWTKLQTQATSNTLPDIFWMTDANIPLYADGGKLASIQPLVDDGEITLANYPSGLVASYDWNGIQYGVPKDFDTFAVWYNPALFAQAGVAEPSGDWTWSEFSDTAQRLQSALSADGDYAVVSELTGFNSLYNSIWQAGGDILNSDKTAATLDTPEVISAIQFWKDLADSGSMPTPQQLSDTSALDWFGNGKAAMYLSGSYDRPAIAASTLGTAVDVAPLPADVQQATVTGGLANVVAAGGSNMQAARAFQAFLASKDAQQEQGDLGSIIPAFNGTQQGWLATMPDTSLSVFIDSVQFGHPQPVTLNTMAWSTKVDEIFVQAVEGTLTAQEAAKQMQSVVDDALKKEN